MNPREKILLWAVVSVVIIGGGGFGLRTVWQKPIKEADRKIADARAKLDKLRAERRAYFEAEDLVKRFTQRAFADQVDQASAKSGEMLTKTILKCGLPEDDFSRLPAGPRKLPGASEVGWTVQGEGRLSKITDLLFMLQESPYLHRVDGLTLSTGDNPGDVHVRFRFLTLVMEPAPVVDPIDLQPKFTLQSPERLILDGIVKRDLLRPYIKRQPVPQPGSVPGQPGSTPSPGTAPGPETFKVVSLSSWGGSDPEVFVFDATAQKTLRFKPGDTWGGGVIAMVDYRMMPHPTKQRSSESRVILRIGAEYWAIELGQTLAEKYKLSAAQLPEQLAKLGK
jgi:hypothetical protein